MSNLYNQQLNDALKKVRNASQQNELTETNIVQGAKLALYHAHGLTSKNNSLLQQDLAKMHEQARQNHVASIASTATQNIVTTSNAAVIDASNTTSSASATAASIQKAATALTNLYGTVAATLAVANSLDNGSRILGLVKKAEEATKKAAKLAEEASIQALNLTIDASQSRAAGVVTQAGAVKTNVTSLLKSMTSTFTKQQDLVGNDLSAVMSAVAAESVQAGVFKTSFVENKALLTSMGSLNSIVNNNLTCAIAGMTDGKVGRAGCAGDQFTLSFHRFKEEEDNQPIVEEYRLILVKQDDAAAFNVETAKSTPRKGYVTIKPSPNRTLVYSQDYVTADFLNANGTPPAGARLACDFNGTPVTRGVPYTFFVYVVYTNDYQRDANDTNGLLSLAGPAFMLEYYLPAVQTSTLSLQFYKNNQSDAVRAMFKVPVEQMQVNEETNLNDLMEFRMFLFNDTDRQSYELNQYIQGEEKNLFKLEDTLRQREEQYQIAQQAYDAALVHEPQDLQDIEKKKKKLQQAKLALNSAKADYQQQKLVYEKALQAKISDFFIDEEIMETIPRANYLVAKPIHGALVQKLTDSQKTFTGEVSELQKQLVDYDKALAELNEEKEKISSQLTSETSQDTNTREDIEKIMKDIADKTRQLEAIRSEKIVIETAADALRLNDSIPVEQKEQMDLLGQILADFALLGETRGDEKEMSEEMETLHKSLNDVRTNIILNTAQREIVNDQLQAVSQQLAMTRQYLDQVKTLMGNDKKGQFYYYEASDNSGAFTDNYGEPLVSLPAGSTTGDARYCALIFSMVQESQPEAAKLYHGVVSGFSEPVPYTLQ